MGLTRKCPNCSRPSVPTWEIAFLFGSSCTECGTSVHLNGWFFAFYFAVASFVLAILGIQFMVAFWGSAAIAIGFLIATLAVTIFAGALLGPLETE